MSCYFVKESAITTNEEKQTPLHYAAKAGSLEAVEYLVNELDADLTAEDYCGRTPFLLAAEYGKNARVIRLIAARLSGRS